MLILYPSPPRYMKAKYEMVRMEKARKCYRMYFTVESNLSEKREGLDCTLGRREGEAFAFFYFLAARNFSRFNLSTKPSLSLPTTTPHYNLSPLHRLAPGTGRKVKVPWDLGTKVGIQLSLRQKALVCQ